MTPDQIADKHEYLREQVEDLADNLRALFRDADVDYHAIDTTILHCPWCVVTDALYDVSNPMAPVAYGPVDGPYEEATGVLVAFRRNAVRARGTRLYVLRTKNEVTS